MYSIFSACHISDQTLYAARLTGKDDVKVTSSSQFSDFAPERVIDNDPSNDARFCRCCSTTKTELNPWYQLDFGKQYRVRRVDINGRQRTETNREYHSRIKYAWSSLRVYIKHSVVVSIIAV